MIVQYVLEIVPSTWVRMTAKSKFKPSAIAYYDWKSDVAKLAKQQGLKGLKSFYEVDFYCQMPKSWSKKKQEEMETKTKGGNGTTNENGKNTNEEDFALPRS